MDVEPHREASSSAAEEYMRTPLCQRLGIEVPIIQAPLGGAVGRAGPSPPRSVTLAGSGCRYHSGPHFSPWPHGISKPPVHHHHHTPPSSNPIYSPLVG